MNIAVTILMLLGAGAWPVASPDIVADYHPPAASWLAGHRGIDLRAETGDDVLAIAAGTVSFVGSVAGKPVVTVAHGGSTGLRSTYEPVTADVHVGEVVRPGTLLGTVAATGGHCGGTEGCLHVGLRTDSTYLDPRVLIERRPPVLKPPA